MSEIWLILSDGFDLFEASAARHAFDLANRFGGKPPHGGTYTVGFFTNGTAPVRSNGEVALNARPLPRELVRRVDGVILVAGNDATQALQRPTASQRRLVAWIARQRPRIGRLASIGETAFVLVHSALGEAPEAAAGESAEAITSTSGIELALRMITHDAGHRAAMQVAAQLLPMPERFGAPFRFRTSLCGDACSDERILALNRWIASHLRQRLTNERLAARMAMTERTFSRFYLRATGFTPARAVEHIRLEHACHAIEVMLMSLKDIAHRSGFSSEEVMRRSFLRVLKMSPTQYKRQLYGRV
jgi:transcriptional regulator GlxA family with amidase domain